MKWQLVLIIFLSACGTLGGFDSVKFYVGKQKLSKAIDSLYKQYPQYIIPERWEKFDDWEGRGYDFLDSRIFYFDTTPKEMYYVTFIGDSLQQANPGETEIAIRAVHMGNQRWLLEKDLTTQEKHRITERFNKEIVSRLNTILK